MSDNRDAALVQLAEWEEEKAMEKYYEDEWQKWNDDEQEVKSVTSAEAEEEFMQSFRRKHPGCEEEYKKWLELTHDDDGYLESIEAIDRQNEESKKKWYVDSRCCSSNIEMEQYYQQECEKIRDAWLSNNVDGDDALKSPYPLIDEYYKNKCVEKKQNNNGQNNKCTMCGITGHYTRDCESDENFKQEVLDGCWTFWSCD